MATNDQCLVTSGFTGQPRPFLDRVAVDALSKFRVFNRLMRQASAYLKRSPAGIGLPQFQKQFASFRQRHADGVSKPPVVRFDVVHLPYQ